MSDKQVSTKHAPDAGAKSATSDVPKDHVLEALTQATAATEAVAKHTNSWADTIKNDLVNLLTSLMPAEPDDMPKHKTPPSDPIAAPYWHQEQLDLAKANTKYANAKSAAAVALDGEINNWSQAQSQYSFAMGSAHVVLKAAIKAAKDDYFKKNNPDSHSRSLYLYFTMKEAIAAAIQDHQKSATSAANALASEAGALLAAHATFLDAIGTARGDLLVDEATAAQTYWQGVEQVRDAV